jgi:F-type H+-transporting ATPase subunit epsilon
VTVLADVGERAQEIDVQRAERARQRAEQRLTEAPRRILPRPSSTSSVRASRLMKALIRLQVANRARTRA